MEILNDMTNLEIPLTDTDELCHHGIKGMKWGIRRFQNKDGSLTKAGQKRYDKEVQKLKDEKKELRNRERVKKKMAKLDDLKKDVDKMEKSVEDPETPEQKKARLLNSTNAKELYENRELFTTAELSERINRIDTEARLQSKIVEEKKQSGYDWINGNIQKTSNMVNNATNLYKNLDNAYNTFANSTGGKILEKELGFKFPKGEKPKRQWNKEDLIKLWDRRKELDDDQMREYTNALKTEASAQQYKNKIDGTDKGGNKNGMSRQEIEDLINEMLDEKNLNHSDMDEPLGSYDILIHHGIKGMKWGVHRFYNKDGTRTDAGKKRENDAKRERRAGEKESGKSGKKGGLADALNKYKPSLDNNGYIKDFTSTYNLGKNKDVEVVIDSSSKFDSNKPASREEMKPRVKAAEDFLKKYDDDVCRNKIYKKYESLLDTYGKDENLSVQKSSVEEFNKNLRLGSVNVNPDSKTYESYYYTNGDVPFGASSYCVEGDITSKRITKISVDG